MTCFGDASPEERALIPNVMQPSSRNSIKREEINKKREVCALITNNIYK